MNARYHQSTCKMNIGSRCVLTAAAFMLCWGAVALAEPHGIGTGDENEPFQRDRKAILAMAGNYHVNFSFRETVSFVEGYTLRAPYEPDGHEIVRVIRDDGNVISLQHILVVRGIWEDHMPIKHWRQEWRYEPTQIFEYVGHNVWRTRQLDETERHGKWTQSVFEVDDSPRYAAVAEWRHQHGVSAWTSPPTWRPLPRREASKRDDYDVLISVNRHALIPHGWVHEQDSSKVILGKAPQLLARETGVNRYTLSDDFHVQIAEEYWNETKAFWAEVRGEWNRLQNESGTLGVKTHSASGKLHNRILALANEVREKKLDMAEAAMRARDIIHSSTTKDVAELESRADARDAKQEYER